MEKLKTATMAVIMVSITVILASLAVTLVALAYHVCTGGIR